MSSPAHAVDLPTFVSTFRRGAHRGGVDVGGKGRAWARGHAIQMLNCHANTLSSWAVTW
jgi:hypothetical protein